MMQEAELAGDKAKMDALQYAMTAMLNGATIDGMSSAAILAMMKDLLVGVIIGTVKPGMEEACMDDIARSVKKGFAEIRLSQGETKGKA